MRLLRRPGSLLLLLACLVLICLTRPVAIAPVGFFSSEPSVSHRWVEVEGPKGRHVYDVSSASGVNLLANDLSLCSGRLIRQLQDWPSAAALRYDPQTGCFYRQHDRDWLRAGQRMALAIALEPDAMGLSDWPDLPGVGPRLAQRIENDRHENGDFSAFHCLKRVPGIGPRTLERLAPFFATDGNLAN
ncbi:ComEA family DNA-binding protein [Desulfuromonas thiophila]|jgi:competence protein ComEA|uniref:Helix-hairpin-helix motif-containing protein n=1 Tax=Desulfuromonas thiophila TaxID=57664 RepID=A0A1G6YXT8_9BACT|nr:helix-hairpin-helix domain-containing protein [Desulfuromonas thiophila]MCK9172192.1 helix-hairpin-helix domain-containing protein [Desulfuromonas thiophila]MDD3800861.1 helix-hairpin-helix domain-containing protein [Desulfuromonas thiophila]MDY0397303.1 helix-hairpin-helix domain-containing protein [Desulfuromonas thiophila]SDD94396.1 Helix-hairpin-helix motif-containing protein [Desulfuromonas thiophila]